MDILEKRHVEITSLALDGLAARHKAISSNIANADSPDYKEVKVNFENKLRNIIHTEEKREQHKMDNLFNEDRTPFQPGKFDLQYKDFSPETYESQADGIGGNNVNIERQMAELAKNGMKYNALALLQQKAFQGMSDLIQKGGS